MKRKLQILMSVCAASVLACTALAQASLVSNSDHPDSTRDRGPARQRSDQLNGAAKAGDLIAVTVKDCQDEKLGKVEAPAVEVESGWISQGILSTGEIYRAYEAGPYFTNDLTTAVDNTRRKIRDRDDRVTGSAAPDPAALNVRDRNDQTLTPLNQGKNRADLAITAQIRHEIIAREYMSVNARNVRIVTKDGQVTLSGPVNTADEKCLIGQIAKRSLHSGKVDNQLEVQPTMSRN